jgi:hypothetical protein
MKNPVDSVATSQKSPKKRYCPPEFEVVPISALVRGGSGGGNDASRGFDAGGRPVPR